MMPCNFDDIMYPYFLFILGDFFFIYGWKRSELMGDYAKQFPISWYFAQQSVDPCPVFQQSSQIRLQWNNDLRLLRYMWVVFDAIICHSRLCKINSRFVWNLAQRMCGLIDLTNLIALIVEYVVTVWVDEIAKNWAHYISGMKYVLAELIPIDS